ncbi:MAG TPA: hypothetical protein VGG46_10595, partial [Terriglobales bacterium]
DTPAGIDDRSMIRTDLSGKFVYALAIASHVAGEPGEAEILGYTIDRSSGKLTLIPGSPFQQNVPATSCVNDFCQGHDGLIITQ